MDGQNYNRAQRRMTEKLLKREFDIKLPQKLERSHLSIDQLYELANEAHHKNFDHIPFTKAVRNMLERQYCDESQNKAFAQRLYREYLNGRKFGDGWVALYYLSLIILLIMRQLEEEQETRGTARSEYQVSFIPAHALVLEFAKNTFSQYTPVLKKAYLTWVEQMNILPLRAMFVDLDRFMVNLHQRVEFGRKIKRYMADELRLSDEEVLDLKSSTDILFRELKQLQRYTIKQSYYDDEMGVEQLGGWVCIDPKQIQNSEQLSSEALELVNRSNACFTEFVPFRKESGMHGISASHFTDGPRVGTSYSFDALTSLECKLADDGELYVFVYPIKLSLREIYRQCDMEAQYEFLRFQFVARLFDLLVPREISEQTPSMDGIGKRILDGRQKEQTKKPSKILRDLMTPRIRILQDKKRIQEAQQRELDDMDLKIKRQFLGRVGYPMRLRKGYKPHPDAKKWAKEDGFHRELEDYETWCRPVDSPVPVVHQQKHSSKKRDS